MKDHTILLMIIYVLTSFGIVGTVCLVRFYFESERLEKENESLKEQLEKRNITSLCQGIEIEMLTTDRKALNQEIIDHMLEDYDREVLISMET